YLDSDQKTYALATLEKAKRSTEVEPGSGRTIAQTIATMWIAARDVDAYESSETPEEDMKTRMDYIVKHMALANREYNLNDAGIEMGGESRPACLGGHVNKIVVSLELIPPDVRIIRGKDIIADIALDEFKKEFSKLSPEDQIAYYQGYNMVEGFEDKADEII